MYLIVCVSFITLRFSKDSSLWLVVCLSHRNYLIEFELLTTALHVNKTHVTKFTMTQSLLVLFVDAGI